MSKKFVNPANFIMPININGMDGRVLRVTSANRHNRREILVVYDIESNLEKWWGLAVALRSYGNVTLIDLPGIGGMDSFFSIGRKPTLDNMADYIASFMKLRYKRKRLSVIGIGLGSVLLTRMMQRNSDITEKINQVVFINGFSHKDDLTLKRAKKHFVAFYSSLGAIKPISDVINLIIRHTPLLEAIYPLSQIKVYRGGLSKEFIQRFKIDLIRSMDIRTRLFLNLELLGLDNCKSRLNKTLYHITTSNNQLAVDSRLVEQHFRVIFDKYQQLPAKVGRRMPLVFNDDKLAVKYLPAKVRRLLKAHG